MANISKIKTPDGTSYDIRALGIPYAQLDSTSTSTVMTVEIDNITSLYDGLTILVKNGIVTSASGCTLNVNGLGEKPIYYSTAAASRVTTHFSVNYTWLLSYDSSRVSGGCWLAYWGYDTNSNDTSTMYMRYAYGQYKPTTALHRYVISLTKDVDEIIPVTTVSNSTGTTKALTTASFNPFMPIYYYNTTADVAAGSLVPVGNLWTAYALVDLRYSFNTGTTLTAHTDVYIKASWDGGIGATLASSPITQSLPTSDDGFIYIRLGHAYDTYRIAMTYDHPVYIYKNGAIRIVSGYSSTVNGHTVNADVPSGAKFTDTNNAVAQTNTDSTNADYRVLFSATADNTNRTEGARKDKDFTYNPSTGNLAITKINNVAVGSAPKFTDTTYNIMSQSEASAGTVNEERVISPKVLADTIDEKIEGKFISDKLGMFQLLSKTLTTTKTSYAVGINEPASIPDGEMLVMSMYNASTKVFHSTVAIPAHWFKTLGYKVDIWYTNTSGTHYWVEVQYQDASHVYAYASHANLGVLIWANNYGLYS